MKKECPVCAELSKDSVFSDYINTRLKNNTAIFEVRKEFESRDYIPTEHYLKNHKLECLKDFVVSIIEKEEFEEVENVEVPNVKEKIKLTDNPEFINHTNKSFLVKRKEYQDLLHFWFFKILNSSVIKESSFKENAQVLKIVYDLLRDSYNDLLHDSYVNVSSVKDIEIESPEDLEKLSFNLISLVLDNNFISESTALSVAKIIIKDLTELEMLKQKDGSELASKEKQDLADQFKAFHVENKS